MGTTEENEENSSNLLFTSISRKTLLILINFVIMGIIGLISWKVISTNIPQSSIGTVRFAMGFIGMFSFITNLGFGASHVKKISEGEDIGRCIGTFLIIQLILILLFIGTTVGYILFFWKFLLERGFQTMDHEPVIYLMLGYYISNNIAIVAGQTFVGKVQVAKYQIPVLVASIVQLGATIFIALQYDDPYWLAVTFIVGAFTNFVISFVMLSKFPIKAPTKRLLKGYFLFALPIFVVSALATIPPHVDSVLIQLFWDDVNVAIYRGGQVYSQYLIMISAGLGMILFPIFSKLKAQGDNTKIKDIIYRSERLITMIVGPLAAMLFALAIPVVTFLGSSEYRESYLVLQPLVVWAFMRAMISPYRNLIMGVGKPKVLAIVSIVGVLAIVVLDLIFIPTDIKMLDIKLLGLGPSGAAYATMLATVITFLMIRGFAFYYQRTFINLKMLKPMIISIISGVAIYLFNYYMPVQNFIFLALYGILGLLIYFDLMLITKGFTKEDKDLFFNVVNPKLMISYLKNELFGRHDHMDEEA
jgi:O-antigen/teichoic acid export membrane protein